MARDDLDDLMGQSRPGLATSRAAKRSYEPFKPVDRRQLRLRVCPVGQAWEWLPYAYLQRIVTEGDKGTRLALIWAFAVVVIEGRNLQELDLALAQERIDAIHAFDPARYDRPADHAAPFIDKIEIRVQDMIETAEMGGMDEQKH